MAAGDGIPIVALHRVTLARDRRRAERATAHTDSAPAKPRELANTRARVGAERRAIGVGDARVGCDSAASSASSAAWMRAGVSKPSISSGIELQVAASDPIRMHRASPAKGSSVEMAASCQSRFHHLAHAFGWTDRKYAMSRRAGRSERAIPRGAIRHPSAFRATACAPARKILRLRRACIRHPLRRDRAPGAPHRRRILGSIIPQCRRPSCGRS